MDVWVKFISCAPRCHCLSEFALHKGYLVIPSIEESILNANVEESILNASVDCSADMGNIDVSPFVLSCVIFT